MNAINVENLNKSYGDIQALLDVSFQVEQGTIFGFLGPNGAGKTTAIGILLQYLKPDSGVVEIFGESAISNPEIKKRVAIIPDADLPKINGLKFLRHTGRYYGYRGQELKAQIARVVKLTGVREYVNRSTVSLSKGQKTRIKIANALVSDPDLVIADEPTSGLDPFARRDFLNLITQLVREDGKTVFFSSHVIGEVEKVSNDLVILNRGQVVATGSLSEISQQFPTPNSFNLRANGISSSDLRALSDVEFVNQIASDQYIIQTRKMENGTPAFLKSLVTDPSISIQSFSRENMELERIFMQTVEGSEQ